MQKLVPSLDMLKSIDEELKSAFEVADAWALRSAEKEASDYPNYADARLKLAFRYQGVGKLQEAMKEIDQALSINPKYIDALRLRTQILAETGEIRRALDSALDWSRQDSNSPEACYCQAALHSRLGEHGAAIGAARLAIDLDRGHVESHLLLAEQYLFLNDDRLARRHLEIASRLKPTDETCYRLALICLRQSDNDAAEHHLNIALESNPKHLNSIIRLAMLKINDVELHDAYRLLSEAMAFYPTFPDVQYGLARVCLLMGRREEAYSLMHSALELNPKYSAVRRELTRLCSEKGTPEASEHAELGVQANPNDEDAVVDLGYVYARRGDLDQAIGVLERAIPRLPNSSRLPQTLGIFQLHRRDFKKAKLAFDAAAQINPKLVEVEKSLRLVFRDSSLMESEKERIIRSYPNREDHGEREHRLGVLHFDFQKEILAIEHFQASSSAGFDPYRNALLTATVLGNRGEDARAIRVMEEISSNEEREWARCILLGLFYANEGDHESASRAYQRVMATAPLYFHALDGLAICFREREDVDDMLDEYLDYARYHQATWELLHRIGVGYACKGMLAESYRYFEHATALDQTQSRPYHALGVLMLLRLDFEKAVTFFTRATENDPRWPLPQLCLAIAQHVLGNRSQAILALQRFIFIEKSGCWRDSAEKLNLDWNRSER